LYDSSWRYRYARPAATSATKSALRPTPARRGRC
jgi:hypothetical protein